MNTLSYVARVLILAIRNFVGDSCFRHSATNIFVQLQAAFNEIFCVVASGRGIVKKALDRLVSLGIILSLGLIMILSLVIDSAIVLLQNWLASSFPGLAVFFIALIQYVVLALLATAEIYALLHFLPDVHLPRRYKLRGCAVITVLLVFGKSAISGYISTSQLSELGGAAASVIVLMLWIYHSSLIVFFGAEMIRSMAAIDKLPLLPKRYAVKVKSVVVEEENQAVVEEEHPPAAVEAPPPVAAEEPHPTTSGSAGDYTEPEVSPKQELINARAAQN